MFAQTVAISLGSRYAGLTLKAQLVDTSGADVGSAITTGFVEIGSGNYLWNASFADDFQGGVKFLSGITLMAFGTVDPPNVPLTTASVTAVSAQVCADLQTAHGSGQWGIGLGIGSLVFVYTVTNSATGLPVDGVDVWITLTNNPNERPVQARGTTDAVGEIAFSLDAGFYYFWKQLSGYDSPTADYLEVSDAA